ncbi:enoyl-CoA hydratase/isomerase family protein [Pseudonocardia acaciae]|uniref:enoyl-CoA hydratase/isomerase family protein n=1 Tax=Pseudonocardia acaciae TaxID=551276 RepID=UPI0006885015|nr:enoyl-CoA hydratase/isomerase family protein [Pseudonocardia acaciae]
MEMSYQDVLASAHETTTRLVDVERDGDHAVLRLADPDKLNVLSGPLMVQLLAAAEDLVRDPAVRSVVLTGSGRAFSAGGDLRMMAEATERLRDPDDREGATLPWRWIRYQFGAMARLIARGDTAFIAALNGPAAGVGLAFALSCDLAIAARGAVLVPAFGKLGLVPEVGTSWALTHALGYRRAFAYYVGGEHIDADRALELGLVNEVVPADELLDTALRWCDRIAELPPHALPMAKPLLRAAAELPWEHALTMEEFAEPICFTTEGFARGVRQVTARTSSSAPAAPPGRAG